MDFSTVKQNLERIGYQVSCFTTAADAAAYLDSQIDGATVGFGGSMTLKEMGLYERLSAHNQVYNHWNQGSLAAAAAAKIYLSSVNGLAQTGEIVNIDGNCNRVASTLYGHEKVYFVIGRNKLAPDFEGALYRARNIAAPKNAQRLNKKTPCALRGDKCYDCKSPERICRALTVLWQMPTGSRYEVVLIDEDLGY